MTFQQHVETFPLISSEGWKELEVFPGGFLGEAVVKNPPGNQEMQETWVPSLQGV